MINLSRTDPPAYSGNIPPLVRLLQAYIEKGSKTIVETKKEVMQKLLIFGDNNIKS